MNDELLREARQRLREWHYKAMSWYMLYYVLGSVATVLVITVAAKPDFLDRYATQGTVAWLAALTQGLNTFFISFQKAGAYRTAWRRLKFALIEHESGACTDPGTILNAIQSGWMAIDKGYVIEKVTRAEGS